MSGGGSKRTGGSAQHLAMVACILLGIFVYAGWRMKNSEPESAQTDLVSAFASRTGGGAQGGVVPGVTLAPELAGSAQERTLADFSPAIGGDENVVAMLEGLQGDIGGRSSRPVSPPEVRLDTPATTPDTRAPVSPTMPAAPGLAVVPSGSGSSPLPTPAIPELPVSPAAPIAPVAPVEPVTPVTPTTPATSTTRTSLPPPAATVTPTPAAPVAPVAPAGTSAAGRTAPAPAAEAAPAGDSAAGMRYTVRPGDTLSGIAERFLGTRARAREVFEANRDLLPGPDHLRVGMVLRIPGALGGGAPRVHVVTESDSLPSLAVRYYSSASAENINLLRQANPSLLQGAFRPGLRLVIPPKPQAGEEAAGVATSATATGAGAAGSAAGAGAAGVGGRPGSAAPSEYRVRPGDTLTKIAAVVYRDPERWREIFNANRNILSSPNSIRVGMTLRIP